MSTSGVYTNDELGDNEIDATGTLSRFTVDAEPARCGGLTWYFGASGRSELATR